MILHSTKRVIRLVPILLILGLITACSGGSSTSNEDNNSNSSDSSDETLSIGTTPVGVSYNSVGNGLAKVISNNSSLKLSVKPSNGLSAWGPQLDKGTIQLGVGSAPDLAWGFHGQNGYSEMKNMRALVRGNYLSVTGIAVREDSDIESVADLKGKKIAGDYPGSAIAKLITEAVLEANGMDWDDVTEVPVASTKAGIDALRDNKVDGAFALTPTTPVMEDAHNSVGLKAIDFIDNTSPEDIDEIPQEVIDQVTEVVPGVRFNVSEPKGYIGEKTVSVEYPSQMVASSHLSDDAVYEIVETLWSNYEELQPIHAWFQTWSTDQFFDPNPTVPYHSGAVKFFKDKDLWNDEVDEIQQELLADQ
ncbi:TAXI family TRAP transporter solute-binding subunit [Thalassobacillus sp. CUG 92003]|uniref:TAXI family TRAP transporter solute-binding subunit n=1 Tax=Thalassobacillus sp. CUG 92003 TaxID=2736641 RepID=UPI0015E7C981|nr:TAXI family TRAP transporter solute-binding subunit [Thalassobacillus sp. CUG 92003]